MQSEDESLQKYWDRGDVLVKGQAEVSFEVKGRILYHIYKHPFVNGGKAGVALWPFFYVASYIVPQICHDIYATGVLEVARVGHKWYLKPDCQLLIFHARKERQIQLIL